MYVCMYVSAWLGFPYSSLLLKVEARLQPNLGQRCNRGSFILLRSKVTFFLMQVIMILEFKLAFPFGGLC